jgi:hypothetical protein
VWEVAQILVGLPAITEFSLIFLNISKQILELYLQMGHNLFSTSYLLTTADHSSTSFSTLQSLQLKLNNLQSNEMLTEPHTDGHNTIIPALTKEELIKINFLYIPRCSN